MHDEAVKFLNEVFAKIPSIRVSTVACIVRRRTFIVRFFLRFLHLVFPKINSKNKKYIENV
jgi:hypothetical protein